MPRATVRALTLVLVLGVTLAGCSVLEDDPTREERAVDALEDATNSLEAVETYRYETEMAVSGGNRQIDISGDGAVDLDERAMWANATADGETVEMYTIEDTTYEQCPSPWSGWAVKDYEEDPWSTGTPAHSQLAMFETGDLYWEGTEMIDDREVIRLRGSPSADEFEEGINSGGIFDFGGPSVDDTSATVLIDAETNRPLETTVEITVSEGGETATASITTYYEAYDEDVSIELPREATTDQYAIGCPGS